MKFMRIILFVALVFGGMSCNRVNEKVVIFFDDFNQLSRGPIGANVGAHTEYHYLPEAKPKGNWAISTFRYNLPASWYIRNIDEQKVLFQRDTNPDIHWHPMIVAGDELWQNYTLNTSFVSLDKENQCGIVFRYKNDRCYYFLGVKQDSAFVKMVNHGIACKKPFERILDSKPFDYETDSELTASIDVDGDQIKVFIENGPEFILVDTTYRNGKIAFLADGPAYFKSVEITSSRKDKDIYENKRREKDNEEIALQAKNPKPVLWKRIRTKDFGVGRNLRFGDLTNNGEIDVLIGQVIHHGHKDRNSELSCLTAMTFDGEILWQLGKPDPWKNFLTSDVAFQIHDLDNDGANEVIYCMNQKLIVAEAASGVTKFEVPTPLTPGGKPTPQGQNIFKRILGDCLYFCDLEGKGYDGNIIIKDRYKHLWALNNQLEVLWKGECVTGHYPYAYDIDEDGKDELLMGYTIFDDHGEKLWTLDSTLSDHADGVSIVKFNPAEKARVLCAASDEGMFFADLKGNILRHHYIGHVQNPATANFRDDLPGLETVSVNFWGNQGIIHLYDSKFEIYHDFEPNQFGSMCLPLNWTGNSEEFYVLNANVDYGGVFDGWGRKVLEFPDDGHPDMCNAVLDITGDCRDEIVVWDTDKIWIYTQSDNPRQGKLYKPERNALYNYSNYQATVSLPGWNK